jgi:hypothetical protein
VGEGVAELVRVQPRHAGLFAAPTHELLDALGGQAAALAQPEPGKVGILVPVPDAQVAVQRHGGLAAVREGALAATLPEHQRHVQVQVEVGELEVGQLPPVGPGYPAGT